MNRSYFARTHRSHYFNIFRRLGENIFEMTLDAPGCVGHRHMSQVSVLIRRHHPRGRAQRWHRPHHRPAASILIRRHHPCGRARPRRRRAAFLPRGQGHHPEVDVNRIHVLETTEIEFATIKSRSWVAKQ